MSNGEPSRRQDPDDPDSPYEAAYAHGWEPGSQQDPGDIDEQLGGDDFCIQLALDKKLGNGLTLLDTIRRHHDNGATRFQLQVRDGQLTYLFRR